jgi:hypothetical protein
VALRQDQPVVEKMLGVIEVELEASLVEEEDREDLCDGGAGGGMATLGHMYGIDRIDS